MKIIPVSIANKFGRQLLHVQKNSPQVMFIGGVTAAMASTVLACRATLRLSDKLTETETLKSKAEYLFENGENADYPAKQYHKDLTVLKVKTILNVTKLYA